MSLVANWINGGCSLWRWRSACVREQQYVQVNAGTIRCILCGRQ